MVIIDGGDHADSRRRYDIGGVVPAAETYLEHQQVGGSLGEGEEGRRGGDLEKGDGFAGVGRLYPSQDFGEVRLEKIHFGRVARPKGEGESDVVAAGVLYRQNLAVGAVPELVFVHGID